MKLARNLILFSIFLLHTLGASSADREVVKIKSTATGLLKITASTLNARFTEFANKNPRHFHLLKNGIEIPFYIADTNSLWTGNNSIYFYAEKNDGFLDRQLYDKSGAALNPYYSMYSDTAVYFLYVDESASGMYYKLRNVVNPSIDIKEIEVENQWVYADQYFLGKNLGSGATQSEYTLGEGFSGAQWGLGATQNRAFSLPTLAAGSTVKLETYVSGQSDALSGNPNYNHHLQIRLNGNGSTLLLDTLYKGYECIRKNYTLNSNLFGNLNSLDFISVNDLSAQSDFNTSPYIKLNYIQTCHLQGQSLWRFRLQNNQAAKLYFTGVQQDSVLLFNTSTHNYYLPNSTNDSIYYTIDVAAQKADYTIASVKDIHSIQSFTLERSTLKEFDWSNEENELIIISSKKLSNASSQYKQYRDAGGQATLLVFTEDLYNSYTHGYHHPLAIKRFIDDYLSKAKAPAKNVFLIGKGIQSNLYKNPAFAQRDLVPSIGIPPSDVLYVSSLDYSKLTLSMGIGRIAVENEEEVLNYLDKIKEQESNKDISLWRKNIIHATGGRSIGENNQFSTALKNCENIAVQPLLGGKVINFNKKVNEPTTDNFREKIIELTDKGISLLSYFGHGANYFVEINFGEPEALNNKGKYPVYFLNGCSVGNAANDNSMGENYINARNKGAIGWLASSDLGFASYLSQFDRAFYQKAFKDNYGQSIGEIHAEAVKEFLKPNDSINILHTRQFFYQGDPSFVLYAPEEADYAFASNGLYMSNQTFPNNDSVAFTCIVNNAGKASYDTVEFKVERVVDNTSITYPLLKRIGLLNTDTLHFSLERSKALSGNNKIRVSIDPDQKRPELNKLNNTIEKDFYLSSYNPVIIQPRNASVISKTELKLVVQSSDIYAKDIEYTVEIDTSDSFSSGFKKTYKWVEEQILIRNISLNGIALNSSVYVRVMIKGQNQVSDWVNVQCSFLPNNTDTWIQNKTTALDPAFFNNVKLNNENLSFIENTVEFAINTRGDNARTDSVERRLRLNNNPPVYLSSNITGICLMALHPKSLKRFSYPSVYNLAANTPDYPYEIYTYSGVFVFNTNSPADVDSLLLYLNTIPNGYVVGGYNGLNANFQSLPENVLQALENLGLSKIRTVPNAEPYAFVGYKGAAIGTAAEKLAETGIGIPAQNQFIRLNYTHTGTWDRGSIQSERIGPSKKWNSVSWNFSKDVNDVFRLQIIGIDTNGARTVLQESTEADDSVSLQSIDAKEFPYLQLTSHFIDSINYSPAKFNKWSAKYALPVELSVFPQYKYVLQPSTTQQGDTIKYRMAFINLGEEGLDTGLLRLQAINANRSTINLQTDTVFQFGAGDTLLKEYKIATRDLLGDLKVSSQIDALSNTENISYNNSYESTIHVKKDQRAPLLRVSIDGKTPMQNDLVSPRPLISIKLKDENPFLLLNDSSYVSIELKAPDETNFQKISYQNNDMSYTPASSSSNNEMSIQYQPYLQKDGMYSLRIKVKDASNNTFGNNAYSIDFEVVNASSITHFFPYPNPFTTHTQFVFTLTGEVIPEDLKIQIMTVSGKIVREISKAELGPLRIGHNISQYKWNGTDEYGDRLANGVYIYRVLIKNGKDFEKRSTSADQYFSDGYGKLYLMK